MTTSKNIYSSNARRAFLFPKPLPAPLALRLFCLSVFPSPSEVSTHPGLFQNTPRQELVYPRAKSIYINQPCNLFLYFCESMSRIYAIGENVYADIRIAPLQLCIVILAFWVNTQFCLEERLKYMHIRKCFRDGNIFVVNFMRLNRSLGNSLSFFSSKYIHLCLK